MNLLLPTKAFHNKVFTKNQESFQGFLGEVYKFPFLKAIKTITMGPAKRMVAAATNWAITCQFIILYKWKLNKYTTKKVLKKTKK